jgi:hypothetical protein
MEKEVAPVRATDKLLVRNTAEYAGVPESLQLPDAGTERYRFTVTDTSVR